MSTSGSEVGSIESLGRSQEHLVLILVLDGAVLLQERQFFPKAVIVALLERLRAQVLTTLLSIKEEMKLPEGIELAEGE